nr:T9SS type A sorting domain-containing protein [Candidatus Aminicenantes bacterium]
MNGTLLKTSTGGITSLDDRLHDQWVMPSAPRLFQNYPNPFNSRTTIRFNLPRTSFVTLNIYNLLGQKIETLVNGICQPGLNEVIWNVEEMPGGIYLYSIK